MYLPLYRGRYYLINMKKVVINFELIVNDSEYDNSGFKNLVDVVQSGDWDKDVLKNNKIESSISTAIVTDIEEVKEIKENG